jgi:hypothetical protein
MEVLMESWDFSYKGKNYSIEYNSGKKGEIKLLENNIHLIGKQKSLIIEIMDYIINIINQNKQVFNDKIVNYIKIIYPVNKSDTTCTTRSLGFSLYTYLKNGSIKNI